MKIKRIDHAAIRLIFKHPLKNHSSITMGQLNLGILNTINRSKFKLVLSNFLKSKSQYRITITQQ